MSPPALTVAMISAGFHPTVGGAERQALELSAALIRRGHRVVALTRRLPSLRRDEDVRGVAVRRLWCAGPGLVNALTFMVSLLVHLLVHGRRYDALHVHLAGSPALAAIWGGRWLGRPVVVKLGGGRGVSELSGSAGTLAGRLKLRLLDRLDPQFVAVTRDQADELRGYGVRGRRLRFIPNGVDVERFQPSSSEEKRRLREGWGWPHGVGFLYVGRLSPEKRPVLLARAWLDAFPAGPAAFLALFGTGPDEARVRELAAERPGQVFVHPPTVQVERAYAAADVFVLPSISEGLSNALLEAMASGLTVVASRVGGTAEVLRDGETGLLFDPEDSAGLRAQLLRAAAETQTAARLGPAARRAALAFSIDAVAESYEELYRCAS